jgi:hypothetical protein
VWYDDFLDWSIGGWLGLGQVLGKVVDIIQIENKSPL